MLNTCQKCLVFYVKYETNMGGFCNDNQFYRVVYGNPIENGVNIQSPPLTD